MGIVEEVERVIATVSIQLKELEKGIIVLEESGEDVTRQKEDYAVIKKRLEGFKRGLKKIK